MNDLKWEDHGDYLECTELPPWEGIPGHIIKHWSITIQKRPDHCDRGRYLVQVHLPLDYQEGFPRYYFSLEVAKKETAVWVAVRKELQIEARR